MHNLVFEENHVHSTYSDGKNTLLELLEYNNTHDKLDLTFSDHVDTHTTWFPRYMAEIRRRRREYKDFRVRIGCEVKIDDRTGKLNTTPSILRQAEVVLGSVHFFQDIHILDRDTLLKREYALTKKLAQTPGIDILAHPFNMAERFHHVDPPTRYIEEIFDLCVRQKIKYEYNAKHALTNTRRVIEKKMADPHLKKFVSFGSDVHKSTSEIGDASFQLASPVTVLVTGAGTGLAQSILKGLRLSKIPTRIVTIEHDPFSAGNFRGDTAYTAPLAKEKGYIERLILICKKEAVELILIGTDIELGIIAKHRQHIERATGAHVIVSSPKAIAIADDKWRTVQFLQKNGFSAPASCLPKDLPAFVKRHSFPLVVKPRIGARSVGFQIVNNQNELNEHLATLPDPVIQEYLKNADEEYTCAAFFLKNKSYGAITMKRWLRNGDTYKAIIEKNPKLEAYIQRVAERLHVYGPCNIQLRRAGSTYKIFEINCRFSGTTGTQSYLGFNVINALLQNLFFHRPLKALSFKPAIMMRYWNELFADKKQLDELERSGKLQAPQSKVNIF